MKYSGNYKEVPLFVIFDLDRTLLDSNGFADFLLEQLHSFGVSSDEIQKFKDYEVSQRGKGFDEIYEASQSFSDKFDKQKFLASARTRTDLIYRNVPNLFRELRTRSVPVGVMTSGSVESQTIKLQVLDAALGKNLMPFAMIVNHHQKAAWLAENSERVDAKGRVVPEGLFSSDVKMVAKCILVVDDKLSNLESDAKDIKGILIDNNQFSGQSSHGIAIERLSVEMLLDAAGA